MSGWLSFSERLVVGCCYDALGSISSIHGPVNPYFGVRLHRRRYRTAGLQPQYLAGMAPEERGESVNLTTFRTPPLALGRFVLILQANFLQTDTDGKNRQALKEDAT